MITDEQFAAAECEMAALLGKSSEQQFPDRGLNQPLSNSAAVRITRAIKTAQAEAAAARRIGKIMARVQFEYSDRSHLQ